MIQTIRRRVASPTLVACGVTAILILGGTSSVVAFAASIAAAATLATVDAVRGVR